MCYIRHRIDLYDTMLRMPQLLGFVMCKEYSGAGGNREHAKKIIQRPDFEGEAETSTSSTLLPSTP